MLQSPGRSSNKKIGRRVEYKKYLPAQMMQAYRAVVRDGSCASEAARLYQVPSRTLYDQLNGKVKLSWAENLLTVEEEEVVVQFIEKRIARGVSLTREDVIAQATKVANSRGSKTFEIWLPNSWYDYFKSHWRKRLTTDILHKVKEDVAK